MVRLELREAPRIIDVRQLLDDADLDAELLHQLRAALKRRITVNLLNVDDRVAPVSQALLHHHAVEAAHLVATQAARCASVTGSSLGS